MSLRAATKEGFRDKLAKLSIHEGKIEIVRKKALLKSGQMTYKRI